MSCIYYAWVYGMCIDVCWFGVDFLRGSEARTFTDGILVSPAFC